MKAISTEESNSTSISISTSNSTSRDFTCKPKLAIIIIGASGDLAKRKLYTALLALYERNLLPSNTAIWGYARSNLTHESLREQIRPFLQSSILRSSPSIPKTTSTSTSPSPSTSNISRNQRQIEHDEDLIQSFLNMCFYQRGTGYDDVHAFHSMYCKSINHNPTNKNNDHNKRQQMQRNQNHNHLFYLAIPPNLFHSATKTITQAFASIPQHSLRVLFEKPFGKDTNTYLELSNSLAALKGIHESQMLRIDHYLGKDMIRAIPMIRFQNPWARAIWNRNHISHIIISMKEEIGTHGRGGYFDQYGIIRDIIQNHLLQVLTLIAMEEPAEAEAAAGSGLISGSDSVPGPEVMRDAKCRVLSKIVIPTSDDCVIGQYDGYRDDEQVPNDSCTPTFAAMHLFVDNDRWKGVPFVLLAGKCLEERSAEVRIVFRRDNTRSSILSAKKSNELIIRIQPEQTVALTTNVTANAHEVINRETMILDLEKNEKKNNYASNNGAYSKLILDALRGNSSSFVRDDELRLSWEIFTPLLHQTEKIRPYSYKIGSKGPSQASTLLNNPRHHKPESRL